MNARTDHEVLVSIAQLLEELLAEVRHLRSQIDTRDGAAQPRRWWTL